MGKVVTKCMGKARNMELDENLVEDIYAYWEEEIEMTEAVSVQAQTEIHSSAKAKAPYSRV